jgi:predicted permease
MFALITIKKIFAYLGFLASVFWIYVIANEIVNLLTVNIKQKYNCFKFK